MNAHTLKKRGSFNCMCLIKEIIEIPNYCHSGLVFNQCCIGLEFVTNLLIKLAKMIQ